MTGRSVAELAAVEAERGHLALAGHLPEIIAVLELLGPQVDLDQIVSGDHFEQRDMRGKRAGAGGMISFIEYLL